MLKLLLCIFSALLVSGLLLHLKHQKTQINYQTNQAHKRLQNLQIELWNQQRAQRDREYGRFPSSET
jgi:hypothetical protein